MECHHHLNLVWDSIITTHLQCSTTRVVNYYCYTVILSPKPGPNKVYNVSWIREWYNSRDVAEIPQKTTTTTKKHKCIVLEPERNEEFIDFAMMCVFLCLFTLFRLKA